MESAITRRKHITGIVIFLLFLGLYLWTLSPGIQFEDTGEFSTSAAVLGVSHPPGFPLYNMAGRLFQTLPLSADTGPGFGANAMSAFFCALGIAVLFYAATGLGFSTASSVISAAACGISLTLWSRATVADVYAPGVFFFSVLMLLTASAWRNRGRARLFSALILGLAAGCNYIVFLAFLPIAALIAVAGGSIKKTVLSIVSGLFALCAAVSLFIYLPLRAAGGAVFNWRDPQTFSRFMEHVTRLRVSLREESIGFNAGTFFLYVRAFFERLPGEFFIVFLFLMLIGAGILISERKKLFFALAWLFLAQTIGAILFTGFHATPMGYSEAGVFYTGAYLSAGLLLASGIDGTLKQLKIMKAPSFAGIILVAGLAGCLFFSVRDSYSMNDLRKESRPSEMMRDMLKYPARDSFVYLQGAQTTLPLAYYRYAVGMRKDLTLIDSAGNISLGGRRGVSNRSHGINSDLEVDKIVRRYSSRYPQALTYPKTVEGVSSGFIMRGPYFIPSSSSACLPFQWDPLNYGISGASLKLRNYDARIMAAYMEIRVAECGLLNKATVEGLTHIKNSIEAMKDSPQVILAAGSTLERYNFTDAAEKLYTDVRTICPTCVDSYIQEARMIMNRTASNSVKTGKPADFTVSKDLLGAGALSIAPKNIEAKLLLATIAKFEQDYQGADQYFKELLDENPDSILIINNLANLYIEMKKTTDAQALFSRAMEIDPDAYLTTLNYGSFLMESEKLPEAITMLERNLQLAPGSAFGHYNLALAFQGSGDYNSAIAHYWKAVESAPGLERGWINLVMLNLKLGRFSEAQRALNEMRTSSGGGLAPLADKLEKQIKSSITGN